MTNQHRELMCHRGCSYCVHIVKRDPFTGCATKDGFRLSCKCYEDHRVATISQKDYCMLTTSAHRILVKDCVKALLREKTQVLYDHGLWPWNSQAKKKHRAINLKLEALGVYQGRKL